MSIALPIDELGRFQVCIKLAQADGRLSLSLKPTSETQNIAFPVDSGLIIHFETTEEQNGHYGLCVFATVDPKAQVDPKASINAQGKIDGLGSYDLSESLFNVSKPQQDVETVTPMDSMMGSTFQSPIDIPCDAPDYSNASWHSEWDGHLGGGSNAEGNGSSLLPSFFHTNALDAGSHEDTCTDSSASSLLRESQMPSQFDIEWPSLPGDMYPPAPAMQLASPPSTTSATPTSRYSELPSPPPDTSETSCSPHDPSITTTPQVAPSSGKQRRRRFSCVHPDCDRQFTSAYTRRIHMGIHEPKPRKALPCTVGCSEVFSRQHDRLRHEVAQHGKQCEWSCSQCRRFFSSERMLQQHKCRGPVYSSRWTVPEPTAIR